MRIMYRERQETPQAKTLAPTEEIETEAGDVLYYQRYCKLVSEDRHTYHAH